MEQSENIKWGLIYVSIFNSYIPKCHLLVGKKNAELQAKQAVTNMYGNSNRIPYFDNLRYFNSQN